MDKFDLQIAALQPSTKPVRLDERQFMEKITQLEHARRIRRMLISLLMLAGFTVLVGMLFRNISELLSLTIHYSGEIPSMFSEFQRAYIATITWPGTISILCLIALAVVMRRTRKDITGVNSRRTNRYVAALGFLAFGLSVASLLAGPTHANAQQDNLKRTLNTRGHLEVRVGDNDFELYGKSQASDESIRNQALIERIRNFDISKAYPQLKNMFHDGLVAEIRAINPKDDCVFYVERRLEPVLNEVVDANAACIRSSQKTYYLNQDLEPINAPTWKVGQTLYRTDAQGKSGDLTSGGMVIVLLDGKADQYVARNNGEKIVPKDQPSTGVRDCGIDWAETCPDVGGIEVFNNFQDRMAHGGIGSSIAGDSFKPQPDSQSFDIFASIVSMNSSKLQLKTDKGQQFTISWPRDIIEQFNKEGAKNYDTVDGPLKIVVGDHLTVRLNYKKGMDLQKLTIHDVSSIVLALKSFMPDPLLNQPYDKEKAMETRKY